MNLTPFQRVLIVLTLLLSPTVVQARGLDEPDSGRPEITGQASVIDGDTIEIQGRRIRLFGIDAPEAGQDCEANGKRYRCGQKAALALADKIGQRPVSCQQKDTDKYGRAVAVCRIGTTDLNGWMVVEGWALAYRHYSSDYVDEEDAARAAHKGVWAGAFVAPWDWRHEHQSAASDKPSDCQIKGNINSKGEHIYHVPGGEYYDRTMIDTSKGERWFCSEAEARAAGWRRSLR